MPWGPKQNAAQLTTLSDVIQFFDLVPVFAPGESGQGEVEYDPVSTPTDNLSVHIQLTLDDSSENWDDEDFMSFTIPNTFDPAKKSFLLSGIYKARVGCQSTGTTDDHTSADFSLRQDGVSA